LAQIGLLDTRDLPVIGAQQAHKVLDKTLPSNQLMGEV
jgi:carboxymethylenebutenolidase